VIIESKNKRKIPVSVSSALMATNCAATTCPVGSYISIEDGTRLRQVEACAKIPRKLGKIQDITGGLAAGNGTL
jgi:DNA-directed RNA polymerase subunit beta'